MPPCDFKRYCADDSAFPFNNPFNSSNRTKFRARTFFAVVQAVVVFLLSAFIYKTTYTKLHSKLRCNTLPYSLLPVLQSFTQPNSKTVTLHKLQTIKVYFVSDRTTYVCSISTSTHSSLPYTNHDFTIITVHCVLFVVKAQ